MTWDDRKRFTPGNLIHYRASNIELSSSRESGKGLNSSTPGSEARAQYHILKDFIPKYPILNFYLKSPFS
jgi:hypothetical protein